MKTTVVYTVGQLQDIIDYVRAHLMVENCHINCGAIAPGAPTHAERVERLYAAYKKLPLTLFDEVNIEDAILYKDLIKEQHDQEHLRTAGRAVPGDDAGTDAPEGPVDGETRQGVHPTGEWDERW